MTSRRVSIGVSPTPRVAVVDVAGVRISASSVEPALQSPGRVANRLQAGTALPRRVDEPCSSGSWGRWRSPPTTAHPWPSAARNLGPCSRSCCSIAGAVVPIDRLVDAVWGDEPPPNAPAALRAYVSRLRAVLPPLPAVPDCGTGPPATSSASATRNWTPAGSHAARRRGPRTDGDRGPRARRWSLLDTALAPVARATPWPSSTSPPSAPGGGRAAGGPAAGGDRGSAPRRCCPGPRRRRRPRAGGAGRPAPRAGAARRPAHACPLRHRPADRGAAVYRDLRQVLVDELGVEPSEAARAVHRQLLAHDPALLPPAPARPTNLPRRATSFVGRGDSGRRRRRCAGRRW